MKNAKATPNHSLRRERELRGWSQCYVADQISAPASSYIHRWEKGLAFPSPFYREKLCALFQRNADELGFPVTPTPRHLSLVSQDSNRATNAPSHLWHVPYQRNPFFTGREEALNDLYTTFFAGKGGPFSQVQALSGIGGIGKTQTAIEYIYRYRDAYAKVLWMQSETREDLNASCVALSTLLKLPPHSDQKEDCAIELIRLWLTNHENWLLILDNIEDFSLLQTILPIDPQGHTLLTTRTQATGGYARCVTLKKMGCSEGALVLLRRAKYIGQEHALKQMPRRNYEVIQDLSKVLDGLPLALDQAGAYIEETGCGPEEYLNHYQERSLELLDRRGAHSLHHPHSVSATFALAFERLERYHPLAAHVLQLCAFLHPYTIPQELIIEGAHVIPGLRAVITNPLLMDEAMVILRSSSLLHRNSDLKTFEMHRLVQTVLRERCSLDEQRQMIVWVICIVSRIFPDPEDSHTWSHCQRYLQHAFLCAAYIEQANIASQEAVNLLSRVATYVWRHARFRLAEQLIKQLLGVLVQLKGLDAGAECLNNLGVIYHYQGRHRQAELLYLRALEIRERVLGREHLDVAETLQNLGALYMLQERPGEAEILCLRALSICEQRLDPMDLNLARSFNIVANLYCLQGKYHEGEELYKRALAIRERKLGVENHLVALTLNDLGRLYTRAGKYDDGEKQFRRSLIIYEQTLGETSPFLAQVLKNFSALLTTMEREDEASELRKRADIIQAAHARGEMRKPSVTRDYL